MTADAGSYPAPRRGADYYRIEGSARRYATKADAVHARRRVFGNRALAHRIIRVKIGLR